MINLLFITNIFDDHLKGLINALKALEFNCILHPLNNQKWPKEAFDCFDSVQSNFVQASCNIQLILVTVNSQEPIDSIIQLDVNTHRNKLIIDISRCSLKIKNENERKIHIFLKYYKPYVIGRDDRQLLDPEGKPIPCEAVISKDYIKYSYLPRPLIADIVWFLQKRNGNELILQPPSTYIEDLISAPIGDKDSNILADKILKIDKYFSYALFRKELNGIISNDSIPQNLKIAASHDKFFWNSSLAILRHLPENSHVAKDLLILKSHLTPKLSINNGKLKKRILLFVVRKQRDLFIDLIVRYWLENLGYEVTMRSLEEMPQNSILELLPDVIIWGAKTTGWQMRLARFAADRNILSIVRREEATASYKTWEGMTTTEKAWELGQWDYSPLVDLELFSGEEFADIIATQGHMPSDSCKAVGSTFMDPYFIPNLESVLPGKEEFCKKLGLSPGKKIMLLASRWTYADRDPKFAVPEAVSKKGQRADSVPEVKRRIIEYKEGRRKWLEGIKRLYKKRSNDWSFVFKVHPGEKSIAYQKYFQENDMHIPIILEGYMVELLNYVDLLVHAGSTTGLEAHFKNIPSISFCDPDPDKFPVAKLAPITSTFDELDSLISNIYLGQSNADKEVVALVEREFYGKIDGNACKRAALLIDQLLSHADTCPFRYPGDRFKPGVLKVDDPYGQNVTQEEVDHYYPKVKMCFDNGVEA